MGPSARNCMEASSLVFLHFEVMARHVVYAFAKVVLEIGDL